jgi:hypothetical protein
MITQRRAPTTRRVLVAQPAAGANWTRTNDSGCTWIVHMVAFRLAASAVAATRIPHIRAAGGDDAYFHTTVNRATFVNQTRDYCGFAGADVSVADADVCTISWPSGGLVLSPGHVIRSTVQNIDVGDQLSAIILTVVETPDALPTRPHLDDVSYQLEMRG